MLLFALVIDDAGLLVCSMAYFEKSRAKPEVALVTAPAITPAMTPPTVGVTGPGWDITGIGWVSVRPPLGDAGAPLLGAVDVPAGPAVPRSVRRELRPRFDASPPMAAPSR